MQPSGLFSLGDSAAGFDWDHCRGIVESGKVVLFV